jgi:hypothetical protein
VSTSYNFTRINARFTQVRHALSLPQMGGIMIPFAPDGECTFREQLLFGVVLRRETEQFIIRFSG